MATVKTFIGNVRGPQGIQGPQGPQGEKGDTGEANYTTEEQVIGTWIDGKPLYRKVITCNAITNNGETTIDTNLENAIVVNIEGTLINTEKSGCFDIPFHVENLYLYINTLEYGKKIRIRTNDYWDGFSLNLILEYIKTTD